MPIAREWRCMNSTTVASKPEIAQVRREVPQSSAPAQSENKWVVFAIIAIGVFMATLDSSIVNVGLPAIAKGFGVSLSGSVEWIIIAYLITTAAIILSAGRLADMVGYRIVWTVGLILF